MHLLHISLQGCLKAGGVSYGLTADTGGHIKYLLDLTESLAAADPNLQQTVVTRWFDDAHFEGAYQAFTEQLGKNVTLRRIKGGTSRYLSKEDLHRDQESFDRALLCEIAEGSLPMPDLVHAHYADAATSARRLEKRFGVPYVFSGHSLGRVKLKELDCLTTESLQRRIETEEDAIAGAAIVIASSRSEAEEQLGLYAQYDPVKVRIMRPGTVLPDAPSTVRSAFESKLNRFLKDPSKPLIGAMARPVARKNLRALVEAYGRSAFLQEHANLLILAGCRMRINEMPTEEKECLLELLQLIDEYDLYGKVALPKDHDPSEVAAFYQLLAEKKGVFVNPARHEPFGLTLLEAASFGVPLVATQNGGACEIVEETGAGVVIDPFSDAQKSLREALESVLGNEAAYRAFAQKAQQSQILYSWQAHAQRYLKMADQIRTNVSGAFPTKRVGRRLVCCDIDDTLTGDYDALQQLAAWLDDHPEMVFVISTGRRVCSAVEILKRWDAPLPKYLVTSVGSEIYRVGESLDVLEEDTQWAKKTGEGWVARRVETLVQECVAEVFMQPSNLQRARKSGFYYTAMAGETPGLVERKFSRFLREHGVRVNVVYSHGRYLDVLPPTASKGDALEYLCQELKIRREHAIAAGDSGNDRNMLERAGRSVVVGGGRGELDVLRGQPGIHFAKSSYAAGVLEGLQKWEQETATT